MRKLILPIVGLLVATGCSGVQSKDLRTSGLKATITVVAGRDSTDVYTSFSAGGLTSVELDQGDSLSVQADGQTASLGRSNVLGQRTYHATLPGVTGAGDTVTVALKRGSGNTSAPMSTVQLPTAIVVSAPAAGSSVSRAHALVFKVDSTEHDTRIEWSGSCVEPGGIDLNAGDPVVVPAGRVVVGKTGATSCPVDFAFTRRVYGNVDSAYKSGHIEAQRVTSVRLVSVG